MSKAVKNEKKEELSQPMKTLFHSRILSNFDTNFQFTKQLGIELLKGTAIVEHFDVLRESIKGLKEFIELIEEELIKRKDK